MENGIELARRFREVMLDGTWIANTNFCDQLEKITYQEAIHKVATLNTISALTFHINYYIAGVLQVFEGGTLDIRDKYSFDLPPLTQEKDWTRLKDTLWLNTEKFAIHVEQMTDEKLSRHFVDKKYGTYRRNIEAMIEHGYYHLGQVSLIRKMIKES